MIGNLLLGHTKSNFWWDRRKPLIQEIIGLTISVNNADVIHHDEDVAQMY